MRERVKKPLEAIDVKTGHTEYFESLADFCRKYGVCYQQAVYVLSPKERYKYYRSAKGWSLRYLTKPEVEELNWLACQSDMEDES